jgi:enoyl-CoA hydratase/carnithine racemase
MSAAQDTAERHILVSREGAVQIVRFNRPDKKNAITRAMYAALAGALADGEADDAVRCHVILGQPGAFTSGNDLADFLAFATTGEMGTEVLDLLRLLPKLEKPVVSGVDGLAIGIGTTLHLHCDLTFATPRSVFKTPFVDLALVAEAGSSMLVPAITGHQRAFALLAMCEDFSGDQAADAGLIWKVVAEDDLERAVMGAAKVLAAKPPKALALTKRLMKGDTTVLEARIAEEADLFAAQLKSDEARQAFMAFMARKK